MSQITRIIQRIEVGDTSGADELLPLVYDQLRKIAEIQISREIPGQTLQATALVHEAYVRLVDVDEPQHWNGRAHFFGAAAEAMRRIVVDHAREKKSLKRGGRLKHIEFNDLLVVNEGKSQEILAVNEALTELENHDQQAAELVKLRYFVGMQHQEAASAMGISRRVADRLWLVGRTWLFKRLKDTE